MDKIFSIAKREIFTRVKTKSFLVSLLVTVVAVVAAILVPHFINTDQVTKVAVTGKISWYSADKLADLQIETREIAPDSDLKEIFLNDDIALIITPEKLVLQKPIEELPPSVREIIAQVQSQYSQSKAVDAAQLTLKQVEALNSVTPLQVTALEQPKKPKSQAAIGFAVAGVLLTFLIVQTYGSWVLMSVIEEKSSRVVEVLLSTMRPVELLVGKVSGIFILTVGHALSIIIAAVVALYSVNSALLSDITPARLAMSGVWMLMGYAVYAWMFAAAGSLCTRMQDAQSVMTPIMIPLIFGYIVGIGDASSGQVSQISRMLSYFPLTSPFLMPLRIALNDVSALKIALSLFISICSIILLAFIAAKIYKRGVLQTSEKLSFKSVWKVES
jgi:ABC-2 type transport system permease protein